MDSDSIKRGLSVFGSCYIKRWLEGCYDQLMDMPAVAKLKAISPGTKLAIEALLYAVTAYAEQKLSDRSPLGLMVKTVLMDAAPEISRRLLKDARTDLNGVLAVDASTAAANQLPSPQVITKLLALDDGALLGVLASLEEMDDASRAKFKTFAATASQEELKRFGSLPTNQRMVLLSLQSGAGGGGGGLWASVKAFGDDFRQVFKPWITKTNDFSLRVLSRYLTALLWVLKTSGALWGVALVSCTAAAICGRWTLFGILIGVLLGCGGLIYGGRVLQRTCLSIAGIMGSVVTAVLVFLAAANYSDSVSAVAIFFLVGMPTLAIVIMILPLTAAAEIFRRLFPQGYQTLIRAFQMLASAFFGILFFSVLLLLFPPRNPVAFLFIVPAAIAMALGAGVGVCRMNPAVFLRAPVLIGLAAILFATLGVMSMPNLRNKIGMLPKTFDLGLVNAPKPVEFISSNEIDFVSTKDGTVKVWYAEMSSGGYELFRCEGTGPYYTKDGRVLRKADNDETRRKISAWVDKTAEEHKTQREAAQKQLAAEKEAQRAQDVKDRLASYLLMSSLPAKLDFIVCAQTAEQQELKEFSSAWVEQLKKQGKKVDDSIFSALFVTSGAMETFMRGQGGSEIKTLQLSALGDKLLLAKCESVLHEVSRTIADLQSVTVKMSFGVVSAIDGRLSESFQLSATGPGTSEGDAKAAAFGRIIEQLGKRGY